MEIEPDFESALVAVLEEGEVAPLTSAALSCADREEAAVFDRLWPTVDAS